MSEMIGEKKTYILTGKNSVNRSQAIAFLKVQRITKNISQQEIADQTGYHLNAISRLETQGIGSDEMIDKYARALGYELDKSYNFIPLD